MEKTVFCITAGINLIILLLITSCVSSDSVVAEISSTEQTCPEWLTTPPQDEGYFFGIGGSTDLAEAKQKSLVNVGQQYSTKVMTALYEQTSSTEKGINNSEVNFINKLLSDQILYGVKFMDQYKDEQGNYWILTRAPLSCLLDTTEGVLMSYRLEVLQERSILKSIVDEIEENMVEETDYYQPPPEGFVLVEAGVFMMGTPIGQEVSRNMEQPHQVTLTRPFYIGKTEVTQGLWKEIEGYVQQGLDFGDDYPIQNVSWVEAILFCNKLSLREGYIPCYTFDGGIISCDFTVDGYRLPTEAEWEYAARGGQYSGVFQTYAGSEDMDIVGWYDENSGDSTHPVGQKLPNILSIYDLNGNVQEWCWDLYGRTDDDAIDPTGTGIDIYRAIRGGWWMSNAFNCRTAVRYGYEPDAKVTSLGFRLVRTAH